MSESHDNPTLPHGGLGNNPTVLHDASTLADTAMTSIGNPEDLSAESKFDTSGARRRRDEDADEQDEFEDDLPKKRVAIPGPSRLQYDDARDAAAYQKGRATYLVVEKRRDQILMQDITQQLHKAQAELAALRQEQASWQEEQIRLLQEDFKKAVGDMQRQFSQKEHDNEVSENQMANHILQFEAEMEKLREEIKKTENENVALRTEYQRELSHRENEIISMRRRLEKARDNPPVPTTNSTASDTPPRSENFPHIPPVLTPSFVSPTKQAERRRSSKVLKSDGTPLVVVPLRPAVSTSSPPTLSTSSSSTNFVCSSTSSTSFSSSRPIPASVHLYNADNPHSVEAVKIAIREVLGEMGLQGVTMTRSHRNGRRFGRATQRALAISAQQAQMSTRDDHLWKSVIREMWRNVFNCATAADFSSYTPASDADVAACNAGEDPPADIMQLDFSKGWERSRWNKIILRRIHQLIVATRAEHGKWEIPDVSEGYLMGQLWGQLKRSREAWVQVQPRFSLESGEIETEDQLAQRIDTQSKRRSHATTSRSRQQRKFDKRVWTVEETIKIKTAQNATDLDTWKYFRKMLEYLSVGGMSEEEDGVRQLGTRTVPVFLVKLCVWRAEAIGDYLHYIDDASENLSIRGTRGAKSLPRIRVEDESTMDVPTRLPRKMYDETWLKTQERERSCYVEQELQVSEEVFELLVLATRNGGR